MRLAITFLLLLHLLPLSYAQKAMEIPSEMDTPEERAERLTQQMIEHLFLHENQIPAIEKVNLKYARIIQREIIDAGLSSWSMYWKGKKINRQKEEELLPLLTPDQQKQYDKMKADITRQLLGRIF